ncbi:ABC transporter permease [Nocardia donostiensis]|uniref:Peptide ABC transporter permease n=1 Tax=Nocardia donostiensis TaxID=1538463 RepID=A0A1V2TD43_9NOCA|nr:ABC transporter permease [Nocardia donostiensis]ONM47426.1 peptide ABC transporter permease [Nocardia donostiensis]OQS14344.1 peptide ABC transporter permease [Nocardia donostiensis]OQS24107.1 peptide ABC transporter permease [Nocardia donostiensis]
MSDEQRPQRPGQQRWVAPAEEVTVEATDQVRVTGAPRGFWGEAWRGLRRNPIFLVSAALILLVVLVAAFPWLFTDQDPRYCVVTNSLLPPDGQHWFGFDLQGCDIYARTIYGARASVLTGVGTALLFLLIGATLGALAGFYGGLVDSVISRLSEIVYAVPLMLAAIVIMQLSTERTIWTVIVVLAGFTWPQVARIARGAVISAKNSEYVLAARALGVSRFGILVRHVLPNSLGPVIVVTTIWLGVFIVTEATLSFLGVGLPPTEVSWGADIATGRDQLRGGSLILFYPATALALTVLGFIMLGDALGDALDPKSRGRRA